MNNENSQMSRVSGWRRFLDRAAVETPNEKVAGKPVTTWRLCTVTQVRTYGSNK